MQEGREATGAGFALVRDIICKHCPEMVSLECVVQLNQKTPGQQSDTEYICEALRQMGYWVHTDTLLAEDYGSSGPRQRQYWAALHGLAGDSSEILHFFNRVLVGLRCGKGEKGALLTNDADLRLSEASAICLPVLQQYGQIRESKSKQEILNWKVDHRIMFKANGLPWPVDFDKYRSNASVDICFAGMFPREAELVIFLHEMWPMRAGSQYEFVDGNLSLNWLKKAHIDPDTNTPKEGEGSPWREDMPTLTGSCKVILRAREGQRVQIRFFSTWHSLKTKKSKDTTESGSWRPLRSCG